MPFNGLTSFLQMMTMEKAMEMMMYQCPLTGLLHFYPYPLEAIIYAASRGLNSPKLSDNLKIAYFLTYFWFF